MYISEVAGLQNTEEVWVACILITRKKKNARRGDSSIHRAQRKQVTEVTQVDYHHGC